MSGVTARLNSFFPEFWTKTLEEASFVEKLLEIYGMWYASAIAQTSQIENSLSIKTVNSYAYDYYFTVDCSNTNRYTPSESIDGFVNTFELPYGVFYLEALSYDSYFTKPVKYQILFDKVNRKYFIALDDTDYLQQPTLFARVVHSNNVQYPFQHFFDVLPIEYNGFVWPTLVGTENILRVPMDYAGLLRTKAQYTNMMFALTNGGTYDALDSLFGVAFGKDFATASGYVVDFNDLGDVWIDHSGFVSHYHFAGKLKSKFKLKGALVRAYECLEYSEVEMFSWATNPAKFAQTLIGDRAKVMRSLIGLGAKEKENSLVFNDTSLSYDSDYRVRYDMGGHSWKDKIGGGKARGRYYGGNETLLTSDWQHRNEYLYSELDYSCAYKGPWSYSWAPPQAVNTPSQRIWNGLFEPFTVNFAEKGDSMVLHRYDYWTDIRFDSNVQYEVFKNVVIWQTSIRSEWHPWIASVLDFFRPLHLKYVPSPMNGISPEYVKGRGKVRGRHYGGFRASVTAGRGVSRGRKYGA